MSQHYFFTTHKGASISVMMGYDRPLNGYFMVIDQEIEFDEESEIAEEDALLYSNLNNPVSHPKSMDNYIATLNELGIAVPQQMLDEIREDGENKIGNKVVFHSIVNDQYIRDQRL